MSGYYQRWKLDVPSTRKLEALVGKQSPTLKVLAVSREDDLLVKLTRDGAIDIYARCQCGRKTRQLTGPPDSYMSWACIGCHYCVTNCICVPR